MKKVFAISLLCLLINGCVESNRKNFNSLENGMSKGQVTEIMGKPYMSEADQNEEWWPMRLDSIVLTPIVFDKYGRVIGWGRSFWTGKEQVFDVKIDQTIELE